MDIHTLDLFFEATVDNYECLSAADDVSELRFMPLSEIDASFFGLISIREAVEKYLSVYLRKARK